MLRVWITCLMLLQPPPVTATPDDVRAPFKEPDVTQLHVPTAQLKSVLELDRYVPVPAREIDEILRAATAPVIPESVGDAIQIRGAVYSARFDGRKLTGGTLQLDVEEQTEDVRSRPLHLGRTSLQQLEVTDGTTPVPVGAAANQHLYLLKPAASETLTGTWTADGLVTGDTVTFRLELPQATTCRFRLSTSVQTAVTSNNGLVLEPVADGDTLVWQILPAMPSRLTFSCRTRSAAAAESPMSLTGMNVAHVVSEDSLTSRWAVSLPSDLEGRDTLVLKLLDRVRILEVTLNDDQPMPWTVMPAAASGTKSDDLTAPPVGTFSDGAIQLLRIPLPSNAANASLTIHGVSVLPAADSWPLPIMTPSEWQNSGSMVTGPVLLPIAQASLTIPASMDLDGWTLRGFQERDVVVGPDNSRVFQLTRFAVDASAVAHCSVSQPRLSETIVTVLESAGRLAAAKCFVNVQCERAAAVQLEWSVASEWDVISVRYASDGRALFFERRTVDPASDISRVTVHLPEAIESQTSRVLLVQLQQSESANRGFPRLPLTAGNVSTNRQNFLIVTPSQQQSFPELSSERSAAARMSVGPLREQLPWLPSEVLSADAEIYQLSAGSGGPPFAAPVPAGGTPGTPLGGSEIAQRRTQTEVIHRAVLVGDQIQENTRITIPNLVPLPEFAQLRVPVDAESESPPRWTLNDRTVNAVRIPDAASASTDDSAAGWERWSISLAGLNDAPMPRVLGCETRRPRASQFIVRMAWPENLSAVRGRLELTGLKNEPMVAPGLPEITGLSVPGSLIPDSLTRVFTLRDTPELIRVRTEQLQAIRSGEAIDAHVFHLISNDEQTLHHEIMAVAHIRRFSSQPSLPLLLPPGITPLAVVDGQRVELISNGRSFSVPLPESRTECDLMLCWKRSVDKSAFLTTPLSLSAVFRHQTPFQQSTHHLLTAPDLDLRTPGASWTSSTAVDAAIMVRQIVPANDGQFLTSAGGTLPEQISPRSFVSRWQAFSSLGWRHRTLVVASPDPATGVRILLTQVALRRATQYAALMVTLAGSLALLPLFSRYRRLVALAVAALAAAQLVVSTAVVDAVVSGALWGLASGVVLSSFRRPAIDRSVGPAVAARDFVLTAVAFLMVTTNASGQQAADVPPAPDNVGSGARMTHPPDLVIPDDMSDSGIAWVRGTLFDAWQAGRDRHARSGPEAIVTALRTRIVSRGPSSVEAVIELDVAALASEHETMVHLPLQQCRVVECFVDGQRTLPSSAPGDAILIPVPPSILIHSQRLQAAADSDRGSDAAITDEVEAGRAAGADPASAWEIRRIECRLRPQISRQPNGIQFRLPALPCPSATISIEDSAGLIQQAIAQTAGGSRQWTPSGESVAIGGLLTDEGIDVRLFSSPLPTVETQQPLVRFLTVCEKASGQQQLTCLTRISQWNPLMQNLRLKIPEGFRLTSVAGTGGTGVSWAVQHSYADLRIHELQRTEFDLELRFLALVRPIPLQHVVPVNALAQFEGCARSAKTLLAVRTSPEFSILQVGSELRTTLSVTDAPPEFAALLRRSDVLFEVPANAGDVRFNLVPRVSYSEVHVNQTVRCQATTLGWDYRANIDTAVLPVFRHRLTVDPAIEISDVQVFAGEANRLDRWHLRGDQLIVILKEGTTGLHRLTIRGSQKTDAAATEIRLNCPQLLDSQILESSLTLEDSGDSAYMLRETGGADPSQRVVPDQVLTAGVPLKFQVVDETDPLILRRRRSAPRDGTLAVIGSGDRAFVLMRIPLFPSESEACHMSFAPDVSFLQLPQVVARGQLQSTVRRGDEFHWSPPQISAGDDGSLTAFWVVPFPALASTAPDGSEAATGEFVSLPRFAFDVHWSESLVSALQTTSSALAPPVLPSSSPGSDLSEASPASDTASAETDSDRTTLLGNEDIPPWIAAAMRFFEIPASELRAPFAPLTITTKSGRDVAALPDVDRTTDANGDQIPDPLVIADTVVLSSPYESASAETTLVVFLPGAPDRITIRIPRETIVTRIDADQTATWNDNSRDTIRFEITRPVSIIRLRWLSERETGSMFETRFRLQPPFVENCQVRHLLTLHSADKSATDVRCEHSPLAGSVFAERLTEYLEEGFRRTATNAGSGIQAEQQPSQIARFRNELDQAREEFFVIEHGGLAGSKGPWRFAADIASRTSAAGVRDDNSPLQAGSDRTIAAIAVRRIPAVSTLLPYAVSFLVIAIAIFAGSHAEYRPDGRDSSEQPAVTADVTTKVGANVGLPGPIRPPDQS